MTPQACRGILRSLWFSGHERAFRRVARSRPQRRKVRVEVTALDEAGPPEGLDTDAVRFEEPSLEEPICRHQRVTRITHCHDVAPSFGDVVPGQMTLERTRFCALFCVEIETEIVSCLDPRHDARDAVEIEIATSAQAVHHLLQPRRAALGIRRDDHIARSSCERP
jgi:hypothetical protein